jgi:HD superfamily phosphodiesterase
MNRIDKKPDYRKLYKLVRSSFEKTEYFQHGPFDETFYTLRVYESAKEIMSKLKGKCNGQQVLAAAILHDVGKTKMDTSKVFTATDALYSEFAREEWCRHAKLSVPIAKNILKNEGHSDEFIEEICYLIEHHDWRGDRMIDRTLELKILQDADLIADCGIADFIRPFMFGGKFKRSIITSLKFIADETNRVDKKGMLNLEVSRMIARKKMKLRKELVCLMNKEIKSDLLS